MTDDVYVVTGATSGLGAEVARRLAARGARVLAVARREAVLKELYGAQANVVPLVCDLETPEAAQTVGAAAHALGPVRGFVHAAGFAAPAPLALIDDATARRLQAVHALFPLHFLGWLGRRANHAPGASAVLVSSLACHEGDVGNAAYAAAKGAVEGLLKPAAAELAAAGVRVNAVVPGVIDTPMARTTWMRRVPPEQIEAVRARYPLGFGTPAQVADVIDFFLSDASAWVTGQTLVVDGGHMVG